MKEIKEFDKFIEEGIVLVDFFTEWCNSCEMMNPILESLSDKFKEIKFGKFNIENDEFIAEKFMVTSLPTIIIFKDGKVVKQFVGLISEEVLEEKLEEKLEEIK